MNILLVGKEQDKITNYLEKFKQENQIDQNYLIEIKPLKEEIVISQIKDLKKEILVRANQRRMIVFFQFETANLEVQNALLKTLEEAVTDHFILITNNEYKIIPTLRSRLKIIYIRSEKKTELNKVDGEKYSQIAQKPLKYLHLISKIDKEASLDLLDQLLIYYRTTLLKNTAAAKIIKKIFFLRKLIQENNLNCQLALDNLLIFIDKTSMM